MKVKKSFAIFYDGKMSPAIFDYKWVCWSLLITESDDFLMKLKSISHCRRSDSRFRFSFSWSIRNSFLQPAREFYDDLLSLVFHKLCLSIGAFCFTQANRLRYFIQTVFKTKTMFFHPSAVFRFPELFVGKMQNIQLTCFWLKLENIFIDNHKLNLSTEFFFTSTAMEL